MDSSVMAIPSQAHDSRQLYNAKYVAVVCALLFALILARSVINSFFYVFVIFSLLVFVLSSVKYCIAFLFFLLPFASILKPSTSSMSFFTVLFFFVLLKMIVSTGKINIKVSAFALLFLCYGVIFSGLDQLAAIVTTVAGLLCLYYVRKFDIDPKTLVFTYSIGLIFSSGLALLKGRLPIINAFIKEATLQLTNGAESVSRFSGLHGNPNYYTLDIIMAIAAIVVLLYRKNEMKPLYVAFIVSLSVLGLLSVSKSFLLTWAILLLFWFALSMKQGLARVIKLLLVFAVGAIVLYCFAYDSINSYIARFVEDLGGSLGEITTGRTDLWAEYIKAIFGDIRIFAFGSGLNAILESVQKGAHNTYLESLFSLGIIGTSLLLVSIRGCAGKISLKEATWLPILILSVRMLAINVLTYDNLWFYLMMIVVLSKKIKKQVNNKLQT